MKEEQFHLKDLKLLGNGGVEATYSIIDENGSVVSTKVFSVKSTDVPHPDLTQDFKTTGVELLSKMIFDKSDFKAGKFDAARERVTCHKITIYGGDKKQVIVTGTLDVNGTRVAVNSPKIMAEENGYNVPFSDAILTLEKEAYKYFFKNKKAQIDIDLDNTNGDVGESTE